MSRNGGALTEAEADALVDAVISHADALGRPVSVAVADGAGSLLCARRSHHAVATLDLAAAKAYSAVVMRRLTIDLQRWEDARPVLAVQLSAMGQYPIIADFGGFPLIRNGTVIGGLGISGARGEEDQNIGVSVIAACGFATADPFSGDVAAGTATA